MTDDGNVEAALAAAHQSVADRDRLRGQLEASRVQLGAAERELREKQRVAQLEDADVEKLESFSGARIWAMLKRTREADLARESAEAEAARGKAAEAKRRYDSARAAHDDLQRRLDATAHVDADLAAAMRAKEEFLIATRSPQAVRLTEIAAERGRLQSEQKELAEAVQAGQLAQTKLAALTHELDTASGWSNYDTFFGGGLISSAIKHDHMDAAAELSRSADRALADYRRELGDVDMAGVDGSLAMTPGTRFVDVWFDNIFTDLHVRSMIKDAQQKADAIGTQVSLSLADCQRRLGETRLRLEDLDRERTSIVSEPGA